MQKVEKANPASCRQLEKGGGRRKEGGEGGRKKKGGERREGRLQGEQPGKWGPVAGGAALSNHMTSARGQIQGWRNQWTMSIFVEHLLCASHWARDSAFFVI